MVNKKIYLKPKIISIAKQKLKIDQDYTNFKCISKSENLLFCIGLIQPTPLSQTYKVKITYNLGKRPVITILSPKIDIENKKLPHTYRNNELCLYYPDYKEWTKYSYISDTILPWISEWLYFYELWVINGIWYGGGKHPN